LTKGLPSKRSLANTRVEVEINAEHELTRETYVAERLQTDPADNGIQSGFPGSSESFQTQDRIAASNRGINHLKSISVQENRETTRATSYQRFLLMHGAPTSGHSAPTRQLANHAKEQRRK
jgi:hypothetical protein